MRMLSGRIQSIEDVGTMYYITVGYDNSKIKATKDLFGKVFNRLPNVGDYVHFTVDNQNWVTTWQYD